MGGCRAVVQQWKGVREMDELPGVDQQNASEAPVC